MTIALITDDVNNSGNGLVVNVLCEEDQHQAESDTDDLVESGSSGKSSSVQSDDSSEDAHDSQGENSASINDTPDLKDWKAVIMNHVPCQEDQHDTSQAEPEPNKIVDNGTSEKSSCVQPDHSGETGDENPTDNSASITETPEKHYAEEDREDDGFVANVLSQEDDGFVSNMLSQEDEHASQAELASDDITENGTFEKASFGQSTDDCGEENDHENQGDNSSFISTSCVQPDHSGENGDENPGDNSASITDTPEKQYAEEDREDDGFVANVLSQEDNGFVSNMLSQEEEHAWQAELASDDITENGTFEKASFGQSTDVCGEENDHENQGDNSSFISIDTLDQTAPDKHRKAVEVKIGNFVEDDTAISAQTSYRDEANMVIENVSQEASSTNADSAYNTLNNEKPVTRTTPAKRQFFYIVRIPRPMEDEKLKNDITLARAKLDEAVLKRDRFQKELREKRVIRFELFEKAKPIRVNERALRVLLQARRAETDSLYQASKQAKNSKGTAGRTCNSETELDAKIAEMQHKIQHESITLKEEKELLREMKRMESTRGEVRAKSAMMKNEEGSSADQEIQSQVELLQKDIDMELVRKDHKVARHESDELDKKLNAVIAEVKRLSEQLSEANELQQNAFSALRKLQMQEKLKNDAFYQSRQDAVVVRELAAQKNVEEVRQLCMKKVEDFMDIWNRDAVFRVEYIKNNEQSTVRRLGTLDGRALGEGESPPEIRNAAESLALKSAINAALPVNIKEAIKQVSTDVGIIHMRKHKKEETNSDVDQVHDEGKQHEVNAVQPKVQRKKVVRSHKGRRPHDIVVEDADIADHINDEGKVLGNDMVQQQSKKNSMRSNMPAREVKYPNGQDAQDAELIEKLQRGQTAKAKAAEEKRRRCAEKAELKLVQEKAKKEAELAAAADQSGQLGGSASILQVYYSEQHSVSASAAATADHHQGGNVTNEFKLVVKKKQQKRNGKNKNVAATSSSWVQPDQPKPVQRSSTRPAPLRSRGGRNFGPLSKWAAVHVWVALAVIVLICMVATLTLTYSRLR
ncbi:hypothetical protein L7F22_051048 [Adiantum nelumboides]|nr:hypothetical protein [Adiantum nelumboides]